MALDRRGFMTGTAALGALAACATPNAGAQTDPMFNQPFVDVDEWRDTPVRHRYVHGGFTGTDAKFVICFPPQERYQGRFFQHITAVPVSENLAGAFGDNWVSYCADSGAAAVASNQGGFGATAGPGVSVDPSIAAYRVSAATAQYARVLAQEMYGAHRTYGYAFGGSGGAFRTFSGAENTDAWDGVIPYIHGSAGSIPNNYAARMRGRRTLKNKFAQIADALEPGGGDVYASLNAEERDVLAEITKSGFPLRTWVFHQPMGIGAFAILFNQIQNADPTYFEQFWTTPGYLGVNPPPSMLEARVQHRTRVTRIIMSNEAVALGVPAPGGPGRRTTSDPDGAYRNLENDYGGGALPVALELANPPPAGKDLTMSSINVMSGAAAGKRLVFGGLVRNIATLQFGPTSGSLRDVTDHIRVGDEIQIDNSNFLAVETYYRHAMLPREYPVSEHLRAADGSALYPQRPELIAYDFVRGPAVNMLDGQFNCKMIVMNTLLDWDAAPWHAHWYRTTKAQPQLGSRFENNYRLWYIDHATHGSVPDPTRTVSYAGVLQQALRDLAAWAERGVAPPQETSYQFREGQISVPATAAERKGVQPVVALQANGGVRADVRVGQPVEFTAVVETPPDGGSVVAAEWDFSATATVETGENRYPVAEQITPAPRVTLTRRHTFTRPGTYYPALRVHSQRQGDAATPFARIPNLGRVRVVVT